ncbi:Abi family protein [Gordonia amicalis]|uniref:Abi family protein n=1 Tax=Gordonia amicalis TaxID=89053 RepID=A0ABU4DJU7_9ACTN|nr:Abi family protein [Gordonia amicalis]MDV6310012.1 Abi family protein [Gordonia amicalis]
MATKQWLSLNAQIARLEERGMTIADRDYAQRWLAHVGYYRLSGYWHPYRLRDNAGAVTDQFAPGTTFADIADLYEFDRHLKNRMLSAVERIEVAMRSRIGYTLGRHGAMAYLDHTPFSDEFLTSGHHLEWLGTVTRRADRAKRRDPFIAHHFTNYQGQIPIWVLTEVLDFADISKVYKGMNSADRDDIARDLGVQGARKRNARPGAILANFLEHITVVRNICAHHSRLWNRNVPPIGTARLVAMDSFQGLAKGQDQSVFASLCIAGHLLQAISPGSTWVPSVTELVTTRLAPIAMRSEHEMGFPTGWQSLPLWS